MKQQKQKVEKAEVKSISIPNSRLQTVLEWSNISLNPQKARARNRALIPFQEKFNLFEDARLVLIDKFCKKDKDGKPAMVTDEESGQERFDIKDTEGFQKEFKILATAVAVIDVLPSNREDLKALKSILHNDIKVEMDITTTEVYESLLAVFAGL
jgi:hypothetical protein